MKRLRMLPKSIIAIVSLSLLFILPGLALAQSQDEMMSFEQELVVKGKVKDIFFLEQVIVVKPNKGKKMQFRFDDKTLFSGFSSLEEIERMQRVKIWYQTDDEENKAVKIEKVPELGC